MSELVRYYAARYALGLVDSQDLLDLAQGLLDDGCCTPSVAALISVNEKHIEWWYVQEKFLTFTKELGIGMPSSAEAVWVVLRQAVRRIIEGAVPPFEVLQGLYSDFGIRGNHAALTDAHGIHHLIDRYYSYEYVHETEESSGLEIAVRGLDEEVLQLAEAWNRDHTEAVKSAWLTPTVASLAESIYADRAFDRLPILADALEEAGCTDADFLEHCRGPGPHVRACWVVDRLLGKE